MLEIPIDKFEDKLTRWFTERMREPFSTEEDKDACELIRRLLMTEMREQDSKPESPFIAKLPLSDKDVSVISKYVDSGNVQVRAYCKDVCHRKIKGLEKFDMAASASDDYLALFLNLRAPWYLLRAVAVRSYKKLADMEFVNKVCNAVSEAPFPYWMKEVCLELRKSYTTEELRTLCGILDDKMNCLTGSHRDDERAYLDALGAIGYITTEQIHYLKALSFEKEYDANIANKEPNTIYPNNVNLIHEAFKAIHRVKGQHKGDYQRIKSKLVSEQSNMNDNLHTYGIRVQYSLSEDEIKKISELLEDAQIKSLIDALDFLRKIPVVTKKVIDDACNRETSSNSMCSYFGTARLGNQGQTVGKADPVESQRINVYFYYRLNISYLIYNVIIKVSECWKEMDEDEVGQSICDNCKSKIIEENRISIWVRGIVAGLRGDTIISVHLLVPQIERYLVKKAELLCGDLRALDKDDYQDEAGLPKALECLKPYFKEDLYNDFKFFFITGADVNLRNRIAHGLMSPKEICRQASYCLWIAIKLFFCEEEIFTV